MKWAAFDVLTLNRGDHSSYQALRQAIDGHAVAALQEMHSVQPYLKKMEADGLGVWRGNLPDSFSDPVVWDPRQFKVHDMLSYPLLPAGRRAGLNNMAKSLNIVLGEHIASGRRVAFGSAHNIQSQYLPGRGRAARAFSEHLLGAASRFRCAVIVGADWNANPSSKSLAPFRHDPHWDLDQLHNPVTTHGRSWCPDGFAFCDRDRDPGVLRFASHRAINVPGTDHKGNSARFNLAVK